MNSFLSYFLGFLITAIGITSSLEGNYLTYGDNTRALHVHAMDYPRNPPPTFSPRGNVPQNRHYFQNCLNRGLGVCIVDFEHQEKQYPYYSKGLASEVQYLWWG